MSDSDDVQTAARRLRDRCNAICAEWGDPSCLGGATDDEISRIGRALSDLGLPSPSGLLDVYRVTLGIPPIQHARSILARPLDDMGAAGRHVDHLADISRIEDLEREGVLWIGQNAGQDLIMDRSGMFGLEPVFQDDGSVILATSMSIEEAFPLYAAMVVESLDEEYESA